MWRTEPLTASHADEAALLYRQFFPQPWERAWSAAEFAALLESPGCFGRLLSGGDSNEACGLILLRAAADEAEIITLGVLAAHRRRGGAAHLLDRAIEDAVARGVRTLFLEVAEDNEPARLFYESHGFAAVSRRAAYYVRGTVPAVAALIMKRSLAQDA